MKDKDLNQPEVLIKEYINVSETCTPKANWSKKWGELIEDTLYLYPSNVPNSQAEYKFVVKGIEIQPAVKETSHMLAFKLVANNRLVIVLEPLNINDMGRWISNLFAAVQGLSGSSVFQNNHVKATKEIKQSQLPTFEEKPSFLINVRSLAAKFEKLSESEVKSKEPVKRSKSTPNLAESDHSDSMIILNSESSATNGTSTRIENKDDDAVQYRKKRNSVDLRDPSRPVTLTRVKSWRGPYISQDEERAILKQVTNPYLAKRNLVKQEQKIQRLEVTVKAIIERVERQKKTLNETKFTLREFKSQATEAQDHKEIESLEEQCSTLQEQIDQSEQSIKEYKEEIHKLEEEMIEISKHINWEEKKSANITPTSPSIRKSSLGANVTTNIAAAATTTTVTTISSTSSEEVKAVPAPRQNGNDEENSAHHSSEEEEEVDMNAPAWVREAQRKSKNAFKILSRQGMLK